MTICDPAPGMRTLSTLAPVRNPLTSPSQRPSARCAITPRASATPLSENLAAAVDAPAGHCTSTSASPPDTRSARLETTLITGGFRLHAAVAATRPMPANSARDNLDSVCMVICSLLG